MRPTVGRQVHYVSRGSADGRFPPACRAATVTEVQAPVPDSPVGLCVQNPTGLFFHPLEAGGIAHHAGDAPGPDSTGTRGLCDGLDHEGGTWHWPGRVTEENSG